MSLVLQFCKEHKCEKEEREIIKKINKEFEDDMEQILLSRKKDIYKKILLRSLKKDLENKKKEYIELVVKYKNFLLDNIDQKIDIINLEDEKIIEIERINKLPKNSIMAEKIYLTSGAYKHYGRNFFGIFTKILNEVKENQKYKTKIKFNQKQKIMVKCAEQSYHFSKNPTEYRPKSFVDPKFNTIFEYMEQLSDINKSIWKNDDKNIFNTKTVIIAYRGTGVSLNKNNFSFKGNWKRDKILDIKIAKGNLKKSKELNKIIQDFDSIYKLFSKEYKFYLTGHSLGGRLAFEIHRARWKKIKECHIFNAGFGLDIRYLHDIIDSKKRNHEWEKNIYNYHIGGKKIESSDDDFISVLSGGYGESYTYYGKFNSYLKGHSISNFMTEK